MDVLNHNNYNDKTAYLQPGDKKTDSRLIFLSFIMVCGDKCLYSITESNSFLNIITLSLGIFVSKLAWDPNNRSKKGFLTEIFLM